MILKDLFIEFISKTRLYALANERSEFATKVDNAIEKIIELLAIISYNVEHNSKSNEHNINEIHEIINEIRNTKISLTKSRIIFDIVDAFNMHYPKSIDCLIYSKFYDLGININELSDERKMKIVNFINNDFSNICCLDIKYQSKLELIYK